MDELPGRDLSDEPVGSGNGRTERITTAIADRMATVEAGYAIELTGLVVLEDLSQAQWERIGHEILRRRESIQWALGDWIAYSKGRWGDTYTLAMRVTGYSYKHVGKLLSTAERFPRSMRVLYQNLSWSHFRMALHIKDENARVKMLVDAHNQQWTSGRMAEMVSRYNDSIRTPEERRAIRETVRKRESVRARASRRPSRIKTNVECPNCHAVFPINGHRTEQGAKAGE